MGLQMELLRILFFLFLSHGFLHLEVYSSCPNGAEETGELESEKNKDGFYLNNKNYAWNKCTTFGQYFVIEIDHFDLQTKFGPRCDDFLKITDRSNDKLIFNRCGYQHNPKVRSYSNKIKIEFQTDHIQANKTGFRLHWYSKQASVEKNSRMKVSSTMKPGVSKLTSTSKLTSQLANLSSILDGSSLNTVGVTKIKATSSSSTSTSNVSQLVFNVNLSRNSSIEVSTFKIFSPSLRSKSKMIMLTSKVYGSTGSVGVSKINTNLKLPISTSDIRTQSANQETTLNISLITLKVRNRASKFKAKKQIHKFSSHSDSKNSTLMIMTTPNLLSTSVLMRNHRSSDRKASGNVGEGRRSLKRDIISDNRKVTNHGFFDVRPVTDGTDIDGQTISQQLPSKQETYNDFSSTQALQTVYLSTMDGNDSIITRNDIEVFIRKNILYIIVMASVCMITCCGLTCVCWNVHRVKTKIDSMMLSQDEMKLTLDALKPHPVGSYMQLDYYRRGYDYLTSRLSV